MQINITGKNLKITTSIRDYINKKITKVIDDFEQPVNCDVILEVEKKRHIAEVILRGDTGRFYLKKSDMDLYKAIDNVLQSADISVKKFKERQKDRKHRKPPKRFSKQRRPSVKMRTKKILVDNVKPMTVEEAILQLKYLKQDVLVFHNAKNFQNYILFKNRNLYNLIQPKSSFLPKFLTIPFGKNRYNLISITYNNKIQKIKKKKLELKIMDYINAHNTIVNTQNLKYLIFENEETGKINLLFRINKNLIGQYEY